MSHDAAPAHRRSLMGPVGTCLLLLSNVLLITPFEAYFPPVGLVACVMLFMHAKRIPDMSFMVINGFIGTIMAVKTWMNFF